MSRQHAAGYTFESLIQERPASTLIDYANVLTDVRGHRPRSTQLDYDA
jgi:hypothetical protein